MVFKAPAGGGGGAGVVGSGNGGVVGSGGGNKEGVVKHQARMEAKRENVMEVDGEVSMKEERVTTDDMDLPATAMPSASSSSSSTPPPSSDSYHLQYLLSLVLSRVGWQGIREVVEHLLPSKSPSSSSSSFSSSSSHLPTTDPQSISQSISTTTGHIDGGLAVRFLEGCNNLPALWTGRDKKTSRVVLVLYRVFLYFCMF